MKGKFLSISAELSSHTTALELALELNDAGHVFTGGSGSTPGLTGSIRTLHLGLPTSKAEPLCEMKWSWLTQNPEREGGVMAMLGRPCSVS